MPKQLHDQAFRDGRLVMDTKQELVNEIDRLRRMLKHLADGDYDSGYTPEAFALCALDQRFDEGDVGNAMPSGL